MKLILFEIIGVTSQVLETKAETLARLLGGTRSRSAGRFGYAVTSVHLEDGVLSGVIHQEYHAAQVKVDPKTKIVHEIPDDPWDETVFLILLKQGVVFFEKKKYSPINLNHQTTFARFHEILKPVWSSVFGRDFAMNKIVVGGDVDYFRRVFLDSPVRRLQVAGLYDKKIPVGTKLHNPNPSRDEMWISSYNDYDSKVVEEINLKAKKGEQLNKSVIAKAILAADADPKRIEVYDQSEDKYVTITKESQKQMSVDVPRQLPGKTRIEKAVERIFREIFRGGGSFRL